MASLPPLSAVRVFEAAARHLSFTRAAEELGMTQAAASYQIKLLEERLGTALFARGARQVTLTAAGERLAPAVTEAFDALRSAFANLARDGEAVLAITALHTVAATWLVPRLGAFQLAHPHLAVRIETGNGVSDLVRDGFDVGLRSGVGGWPGVVAHELFPACFTVVCSPAFQDRHELRGPRDLLRVPLIGPTDPWWDLWFRAAGVEGADLSRHRDLSLGMQQLEGTSALAGHGAALLTPAFFRGDLEAGRLVRPFGLCVHEAGRAYWLTYPEAQRRSAKIRAFRDWILAEAEVDRVWMGELTSGSPAGVEIASPGGRRRRCRPAAAP